MVGLLFQAKTSLCQYTLKSTSVTVCFRWISLLRSAFIFLRWFKLAHNHIQLRTLHDECKQGIDQQIFNRQLISRKITHPQSLFKYFYSNKNSNKRIFQHILFLTCEIALCNPLFCKKWPALHSCYKSHKHTLTMSWNHRRTEVTQFFSFVTKNGTSYNNTSTLFCFAKTVNTEVEFSKNITAQSASKLVNFQLLERTLCLEIENWKYHWGKKYDIHKPPKIYILKW